MTDLTPTLLPKITNGRTADLHLADGLIHPAYGGLSILNLPNSVCAWLGAPPLPGAPALDEAILSRLGGPYQRVVLVLMDGLALSRLQRWLAASPALPWNALLAGGVLAPLTSVSPSTTSSALTTLWTGAAPVAHGVLGYEMWLKEYGVVANTIKHAPTTFEGDAGSLAKAGFNPEAFLFQPALGSHLAAHGVKAHAFQHHGITRSGLSQMLMKDVDVHGFSTPTDLWVNLRRSLESRPHERSYTWVYWDMVDTFGHRYGPDDERPLAEFASFSAAFQHSFLDRLAPEIRKGTLLILTADHGQIYTPPDPHYELRNHPALTRRLHIQPTGENRLAFLFVRPGQTEAVREYIQRTWPDQFQVLDAFHAADAGLFGADGRHPRLGDRLGEFAVAGLGNAYFWWQEKENRLVGRHGGLHPDEMLVPFLAAPLDAQA